MSETNFNNGGGIPARFRASTLDQMNYVTRAVSDQQIHLILSMSGHLDEDRLALALRLLLDAEPVLGCRFVSSWWRPYWERRDDLDTLVLCRIMETDTPEEDALEFATSPLDPEKDPQVQAFIFRTAQADTLCLKVDHVAADAVGVQEIAALLSEIYRNLKQDPNHKPRLNLNGTRSQYQIFREMTPERLFRGLLVPSVPTPTWGFPSNPNGNTTGRTITVRRYPPEQVRALRSYGQMRSATLNEVLIAAFYRALFKLMKPAPQLSMTVMIPVDLRRYIPSGKADAVCNMSGGEFLSLTWLQDEDFDGTLSRVHLNIEEFKKRDPGLGSAVFMSLAFLTGFGLLQNSFDLMRSNSLRTGKSVVSLSNAGAIEHEKINFGDNLKVADGFFLSPLVYAPGLMLGVSRFNDTLTISTGYCKGSVESALIDKLFDLMEEELPQVVQSGK